jgi:methionyl-tRNA formyltransferase
LPIFPSSPRNVLITASFGFMIPTSLIEHFEPLQALNVHPSLLPLRRGAAPIQWTIIDGDEVSGVTVQELSKGRYDAGTLLGQTKMVRRASTQIIF